MKVLFFYRECENLGVEYLMSMLKKAGHHYFLLFDSGIGEIEYPIKFLKNLADYKQKMVEFAEFYKPDLIVFSAVTNYFPWICEMGRLLKKVLKVPIIIGGIHPTIIPDYVISQDFVDMICVGEGEYALLDLLKSMESGKKDFHIENIWFKDENGKIYKNPPRKLIESLDEIPFPEKRDFYEYGAISSRYNIMTSRGCPNNCSYCLNHQLKSVYKGLGTYNRRRSVDNVIEELKQAKENYNIKYVYFYDDIFITNIHWLEEFSKKYSKEIGLKFKCLLHPLTITVEKIALLKKAGCVDVDIGIESGDEHIREKMLNRQMSNEQIKKAVSIIKKGGIRVGTLNMIAIPGETPLSMYKTAKLNLELKPDGILISQLYPYPHSEIFNICKENGLLDEKQIDMINYGYENYRNNTFLKHPHLEFSKRIEFLTPIASKFPRCFHRFILQLPPNRIIRIISKLTITSWYSVYIRLKLFAITMLKTYSFYCYLDKFLKKNKKKL